jgi:hypothetical protein
MLRLLATANVVPSSLNLFTLIMETIRSSATLALTRLTRRHILQEGILHSQRREKLNSFLDCEIICHLSPYANVKRVSALYWELAVTK